MFAGLPVMRLSIAMTRCPSFRRRSARCDPKKPAPPVTTETGLDFFSAIRRIYSTKIRQDTNQIAFVLRRSEGHHQQIFPNVVGEDLHSPGKCNCFRPRFSSLRADLSH